MTTKKTPLLLVALALCLPLTATASPPSAADAIVVMHFQALGGLSRLKAPRTMIRSTSQILDGKRSDLTITKARPNLARFDHSDDGIVYAKAYDGEGAWASKDGAARPLEGDALAFLRVRCDFDDGLIDAAARGTRVELLGKEEVGGSPAYVLRLTFANGGQQRRYIDARSFLEVKRVAGKRTTLFRDYRRVNGIRVSFAQDIDEGGRRGTGAVTRLDYDAPVERSTFARPSRYTSR